MNKGRIHRELGQFLMIFLNLIKSDNEMWIEIRDFDIFGKNTRRRIHRIKNHLIWIKIRGEIIKGTREKCLKNKIMKNKN